ncbi:MAG: hypothetical protein IJ368_03095 [Oscillospiraceae bacterium]|nr:hypothetical protein [Oscillospiraceae bacterium]
MADIKYNNINESISKAYPFFGADNCTPVHYGQGSFFIPLPSFAIYARAATSLTDSRRHYRHGNTLFP